MGIITRTLVLLVVLLGLLLVPIQPRVHAFSPLGEVCSNQNDSNVCQDASNTNNPIVGQDGIITKVIRIMAFVTGVTAVIVIMYAGMRFVLSGGDPQKVSTSRNTVLYVVIGLLVATLAQTIVLFVLGKLK